MCKTLMLLEVSQKQRYIFSSKKLADNARRSDEIAYVTSPDFFQKAAPELYRDDDLVYAGGGHTVLCFEDSTTASKFAQRVSESVLRQYPGMELFVKQLPYDETMTPNENLSALTAAAEKKKSFRTSAFAQTTFGVEKLDPSSHAPVFEGQEAVCSADPVIDPPLGWLFPTKLEDLAGGNDEEKKSKDKDSKKDNFIAVIHIDGNAMGKRVERFYGTFTGADRWDSFRTAAQRFSEGIQADFEAAFREMVDELLGDAALLEKLDVRKPTLPLRPVILAGDDVCFVTAGSIALDCARVFLDKLSARVNQADGEGCAACAGIALVHTKYPFHQAYDLAEELCSRAKKFGASIDPNGGVCAMDWHIEFGQLKDGLDALRRDFETEDGNRLELRPIAVRVPEGIDAAAQTGGVRTYGFFRGMCRAMQGERGKTARGKIKELRTAFKQGEVESSFFLHSKEIRDLLYHGIEAEFGSEERIEEYRRILYGEKSGFDLEPFRRINGEAFKRCLFFDAIEMVDHCEFFNEEVSE